MASEVVSGLIGMLPELVPALAEGIVNLLGAAMRGIDQLAAGLFDGVGALLKRAGVLKKGLNDVISEAFEGADTDFDVPDVEVAPVNVNGEVDASAYVAEIEAAKEAIRGAINGLSLSEADADALEAAIMRGSGAEALCIALEQLDVPEAQAAATAQKISDAMDTIRGTLESLDLSAETREKILSYVAAGGDVQTALETFAGLSPEEAQAKAAELQPALDDVTREINALKLAGVDVSALLEDARRERPDRGGAEAAGRRRCGDRGRDLRHANAFKQRGYTGRPDVRGAEGGRSPTAWAATMRGLRAKRRPRCSLHR